MGGRQQSRVGRRRADRPQRPRRRRRPSPVAAHRRGRRRLWRAAIQRSIASCLAPRARSVSHSRREPLCEARADDDAVRGRLARRGRARRSRRARLAQLRHPARVAVAERAYEAAPRARRAAVSHAERGNLDTSGEPGPQVESVSTGGARIGRRRPLGRLGAAGDARARALHARSASPRRRAGRRPRRPCSGRSRGPRPARGTRADGPRPQPPARTASRSAARAPRAPAARRVRGAGRRPRLAHVRAIEVDPIPRATWGKLLP